MGICPHHCPPEGGSGKKVAVAAVGVLVAVTVLAPAVTAAVNTLTAIFTVVLIVAGCVAGVAVLAGVGLGVCRVVRWRARRAALVSRPAPALAAPSWPDRPALGAAPRRALTAGRPVVPGVVASEGERIRR